MCWTDSGSQKYGDVVEKLSQVTTFSFDIVPIHLIRLTQSNKCIFKYELAFGLLQSPLLLCVLKFDFLTGALVSGEGVFSVWSSWFTVYRMIYSQCELYAKSSASDDQNNLRWRVTLNKTISVNPETWKWSECQNKVENAVNRNQTYCENTT